MVLADYVAGVAFEEGAIRKDQISMKAVWELGREMVQLVRKKFQFPSEFNRRLKDYVIDKYKL